MLEPHRAALETCVYCPKLCRAACRDVDKDIQHASHFLYGVDGGCVAAAVSAEMQKIADHLLDVVSERKDFAI